MSRGWKEMRLETDGRWQATGQLRDTFPFGAPSAGQQEPARRFFRVDGIDTENMPAPVFVPGTEPEGVLPVHTLGWAQFTRP